jgi:broad specificity phosphatase PhoE
VSFPATTIYLLRHGRVENPNGVVKGRLPGFPLSSVGREQIGKVAWFLSEKDIKAVYYSPLLRAKQTAEIVASRISNAELKPCKSLLETETSFAGRPIVSKGSSRGFYARYYESPLRAIARMRRALVRMVREYPGAEVAAVSHGGAIDFLYAHLRGVKDEDIHPAGSFDYGSILVLVVDHNCRLLKEPEVVEIFSR